MSRSDDERIQRLTELARKVWPGRDAKVETSDDPDECGACVILDELGAWEQHLGLTHPRALDALEAALCVLALPETGIESGQSLLNLCRANTELGMALVELRLKLAEFDDKFLEIRDAAMRAQGNAPAEKLVDEILAILNREEEVVHG